MVLEYVKSSKLLLSKSEFFIMLQHFVRSSKGNIVCALIHTYFVTYLYNTYLVTYLYNGN